MGALRSSSSMRRTTGDEKPETAVTSGLPWSAARSTAR